MSVNLLFLVLALATVFTIRWLAWLSVRSTHHLIARAGDAAGSGALGERIRSGRARFAEGFPRIAAVVEARLSPARFTGLPLTLMILAALYIAALLGGLVDELLEAEELITFDRWVNESLGAIRTDEIVRAFAFITEWADASAIVIVATVTTGLLWALRHAHLVMPLWVVVLCSQLTTYVGKYVLDRERPEFLAEVTATTPSFPSGHATSAIAVYGFIAYVLSREAVTPRRRFEIVFWSGVLIVLIGFSRMLLSVHYASDVAAGFLVGGFWLLVGFAMAELIRSRRRSGGPAE